MPVVPAEALAGTAGAPLARPAPGARSSVRRRGPAGVRPSAGIRLPPVPAGGRLGEPAASRGARCARSAAAGSGIPVPGAATLGRAAALTEAAALSARTALIGSAVVPVAAALIGSAALAKAAALIRFGALAKAAALGACAVLGCPAARTGGFALFVSLGPVVTAPNESAARFAGPGSSTGSAAARPDASRGPVAAAGDPAGAARPRAAVAGLLTADGVRGCPSSRARLAGAGVPSSGVVAGSACLGRALGPAVGAAGRTNAAASGIRTTAAGAAGRPAGSAC